MIKDGRIEGVSEKEEPLAGLQRFIGERLEELDELSRVVTKSKKWKDLPPGIVSRRYTPLHQGTLSNIEKTKDLLLRVLVARTTLTQYEQRFEHWRVFLHNLKGPTYSSWIVRRGSRESEDISVTYLCWLFSIGNSYSTMQGKFAAIRFWQSLNRSGNPFYKMDFLRKYMNAFLRLRGGAVGSMRVSVEFVSTMALRLMKQGGLPNLAIASAIVSGWSFILRVQYYVAGFDSETGELDLCVTLTDRDVCPSSWTRNQ